MTSTTTSPDRDRARVATSELPPVRPLLGTADVRSRRAGASLGTALQFVLKRIVDLVGATVILLVLSPVVVLIVAAIWISSPGPVIYRSMRMGLGGRRFGCLKFRTMRADADRLQSHLECENEADGPVFKIERDPRITLVGRWLRSSGLDELPQLFNVLRGQMSLVGPRPLPLRDCTNLSEGAWRRHSVLPGISGPWQLNPDRHVDGELLAELDLAYVDHWNLWVDITVWVGTLWYGLRRCLSTNSELAAGG